MDVEKERSFRQKMFDDITDNKLPDHVPSMIHVSFEGPMVYSGLDLKAVQWNDDPQPIIDAYCKVIDRLPADLVLISPGRPIRALTTLESKAFVMSDNGYIQHPEVSSMNEDEYPEFIEDPYRFMVEVAAPRIYTGLDANKYGQARAALTWLKGYQEFQDFGKKMATVNKAINEKYPFYSIYGGGSVAPMDHLADVLRSFSGISKDVRRHPQEIKEACDALEPILYKRLMPKTVNKYKYMGYPLHMCGFINNKAFEELWWPSFKKMNVDAHNEGQQVSLFLEADCTRFLDYWEDLPGRNLCRFEQGDPKLIKSKIKSHIIQGLYPAAMFITNTKEECLDKAKELIDILAPGGSYEFMLDKNIYAVDDEILDKAAAVLEYVRNNTKY